MANEAQAHGQASTFGEFIPAFFSATFENWQSEFLQLFTMVVLTAFLVHRGSHESKDQDEKVDQALARIERRLGQLEDGLRLPGREASLSGRGTEMTASQPGAVKRAPTHANGVASVSIDPATLRTSHDS